MIAGSSAKNTAFLRCSMCDEIFDARREETAAEKLARFGSGADPDDVVLLCDGCHDEIVSEGSKL